MWNVGKYSCLTCFCHQCAGFGWVRVNFFTVVFMGLCLGFVLETMWKIQGYFGLCWAALAQHQGLFCLLPHLSSEEVVGTWGAGRGTQPGQLIPADPRDISYHIWHHAHHLELGEDEGSGRDLEWWLFVFPSNHCVRWSPAYLGYGRTPGFPWGVVNKFLVLLCFPAQLLLYLLNCPCLNPWVFSLLVWFSPPFCCGVKVSSYVGLWCQLGLNMAIESTVLFYWAQLLWNPSPGKIYSRGASNFETLLDIEWYVSVFPAKQSTSL